MTSVLQNGRELQFWERVDEVTFSGRLSRLNGSFLGKMSKIVLIANTTTFSMALKNQKSVHGRGRGGGFRKIIGIHLVRCLPQKQYQKLGQLGPELVISSAC